MTTLTSQDYRSRLTASAAYLREKVEYQDAVDAELERQRVEEEERQRRIIFAELQTRAARASQTSIRSSGSDYATGFQTTAVSFEDCNPNNRLNTILQRPNWRVQLGKQGDSRDVPRRHRVRGHAPGFLESVQLRRASIARNENHKSASRSHHRSHRSHGHNRHRSRGRHRRHENG
jgi:hypothetical protein